MIKILEDINTLKETVESTKVDEDVVKDWLGITLAGLDDNIVFDDIDYTDPNYITVKYYYTDHNDSMYLGEWNIDYNEMINMSDVDRVKILDNISAEVEASASGIVDYMNSDD